MRTLDEEAWFRKGPRVADGGLREKTMKFRGGEVSKVKEPLRARFTVVGSGVNGGIISRDKISRGGNLEVMKRGVKSARTRIRAWEPRKGRGS